MAFNIYSITVHLLSPFLLCCLLMAAGLLFLWFRYRDIRRRLLFVMVPFVFLTVLCCPAFAFIMLGSLEWLYPRQPGNSRPDGQAIVVLSGYAVVLDEDQHFAVLGEDTLARCLHAADLYRKGPSRPVVVTGGRFDSDVPGLTLAELMRDFLVQQGVAAADVLIEPRSTSTYDNAAETRKLLAPRKIDRIVLVTDATHLLRSERCFRACGFDVVASGCRYRTARHKWSVLSFLPDASSSRNVERVIHEWAGILWYRFRYGV